MIPGKIPTDLKEQRQKVLPLVRDAHKLFNDEKFTQAFNILVQAEQKCNNLLLIGRIRKLQVYCLLKVGNIEAAHRLLQKSVEQFHGVSHIIFMAASFYAQLGYVSVAKKLFVRVLKLAPQNIHYALAFAQFLREYQQSEKAFKVLTRALRENRKKKNANDMALYFLYLDLAHMSYNAGRLFRARVLFEHTASLRGHFPYYDLIGECYLQKGDYTKAKEFLSLHIKNWGENDPEAFFSYAKTLVCLGETDEAVDWLIKCRDIWGELVVTGPDMRYLYPLLQDGSLEAIPDTTIQI